MINLVSSSLPNSSQSHLPLHRPKHLHQRPKTSQIAAPSALSLSGKKKKGVIATKKKKDDDDPKVNHLASELFAKALIAHLQEPLFESKPQPLDLVVLAEKLYETISHETKKGISTTTMMLQDPSSFGPLDQTQITLIHYDTAPHSFNIHIETTPHAIEYFSQHLPQLSKLLASTLPDCEFHFQPPKILSYKQKLDRKKTPISLKDNKKDSQEIESLHY